MSGQGKAVADHVCRFASAAAVDPHRECCLSSNVLGLIVLQTGRDLLRFVLGNCLALLAVSIDVLFPDKHFELLSLILYNFVQV